MPWKIFTLHSSKSWVNCLFLFLDISVLNAGSHLFLCNRLWYSVNELTLPIIIKCKFKALGQKLHHSSSFNFQKDDGIISQAFQNRPIEKFTFMNKTSEVSQREYTLLTVRWQMRKTKRFCTYARTCMWRRFKSHVLFRVFLSSLYFFYDNVRFKVTTQNLVYVK